MQDVFLGPLSLYEIFAYFFLYAFLGWVAEVAFHAVSMGKFVNRGFLCGPVCPIYGVGVTVILLLLGDFVEKPWAVFLIGIVMPTAIEFLTGWILETFFHNKWWDYSERKFNIKGYICLEFSVLWGLAVLFVVEAVHPLVKKFVFLAGNITGTALVSVCLAALLADCIVTLLQVLRLNSGLKDIDGVETAVQAMKFGSDFIGEHIAAATLRTEDKIESAKETAEEKRNLMIDALVKKMPKRILKAFPDLTSRLHPNAVVLARASMKRAEKRRREEKRRAERKRHE